MPDALLIEISNIIGFHSLFPLRIEEKIVNLHKVYKSIIAKPTTHNYKGDCPNLHELFRLNNNFPIL